MSRRDVRKDGMSPSGDLTPGGSFGTDDDHPSQGFTVFVVVVV
jgi:hypothetical protein